MGNVVCLSGFWGKRRKDRILERLFWIPFLASLSVTYTACIQDLSEGRIQKLPSNDNVCFWRSNSEDESASCSKISVADSLEIAEFSEEHAMKKFSWNLTETENFSYN